MQHDASGSTFSGFAMKWIVRLMGGDLAEMPLEFFSTVDMDGTLQWNAWMDSEGRMLAELRMANPGQDPIPLRIRLELQAQSMSALALLVQDLRHNAGIQRPEDPIAASALDRIASKWLAARFNAGHRLRPIAHLEQAA